MVFASDILAGRVGPASTIANLIGDMKTSLEMRRAFKRTVADLSALDRRQLEDLGISRNEIRAVAQKSVYGTRL